jgi:hypothetical protein
LKEKKEKKQSNLSPFRNGKHSPNLTTTASEQKAALRAVLPV